MDRPNPDMLLARVHAETAQQQRGKLKLFFGASPGVGKTYAMLSEARAKRAAGVDVVIGLVETHKRADTEALLDGLEVLPRRVVEYRGVALGEFDIDGALARQPTILLVDELAHSNAPGSRHAKRWQDVVELLAAGIDVYTTVNVQHIESLNDVVAQITGVIVRETVPDSILERADEIELIDLAPEELLERMREGKVYVPDQAASAARSFFRKGNLIALRELSLRHTAERVDAQMQHYRRDKAISAVWPTRDRVLVCVSSGALAPRLVRAGRRLAAQLGAPWVVLYVETPAELRRNEATREAIIQSLRLAEQLGAETVTLAGSNAVDEILALAQQRNFTKLIVGKPNRPAWQERLLGSTVDTLIRKSGAIDVFVISGDDGEPLTLSMPEATSNWARYLAAASIIAILTLLGALMRWAFPEFAESNLIMFYLLAVIGIALWIGRGPALAASLLSVLAFDFFFVPPFYTFAVADAQYAITFAIMLAVALVVSTLTYRLRQQAEAARQRERRTAALYAMSREMTSVQSDQALLRAAVRHIHATFESQVILLLPPHGSTAKLQPWGSVAGWWGQDIRPAMVFAPDDKEQAVAHWVYDHSQPAGLGTTTLPLAQAIYLPLIGTRGVVGVLGVRPAALRRGFSPDQLHLLETFANQTALALERAKLAEETEQARVQIETERLRSSLLSSVSHDLRTPLAAITGAASGLLDGSEMPPATRRDLVQAIYDEADRLNRLVTNLLEMTQLESGAVHVQKEWQPLDEVIGTVLARVERQAAGHTLTVDLPDTLLLAPIDAVLIEQALINLLDNAIKYTPPGNPIELRAYAAETPFQAVVIEVADHGPGVPPGDEQKIFEKFYRAQTQSGVRGAGLGLAIASGIAKAHGGRIWAENRPSGGAVFRLAIPVEGAPPVFQSELPLRNTAN